MTMSTNIPTAIDLSISGTWKHLAARIATAVRAAQTRYEARRAYRWMLESDDGHLLRDVGLTRDDVRAAMRALDGRS